MVLCLHSHPVIGYRQCIKRLWSIQAKLKALDSKAKHLREKYIYIYIKESHQNYNRLYEDPAQGIMQREIYFHRNGYIDMMAWDLQKDFTSVFPAFITSWLDYYNPLYLGLPLESIPKVQWVHTIVAHIHLSSQY